MIPSPKETDTLDGWFDSGSSHAAVLRTQCPRCAGRQICISRAPISTAAWFQSSLLTSVATTGKAPYGSVLTHGWVVDGEG